MRSLGLLLTALALTAGCDSEILVQGLVTDANGEPIEDARAAIADRVFSRQLDTYLRGDTAAGLPGGSLTDAEGHFRCYDVLGGDDFHDVWLVVRKDGFLDHAEQVWAGDGGPDRDFFVEVVLQREETEAAPENPGE